MLTVSKNNPIAEELIRRTAAYVPDMDYEGADRPQAEKPWTKWLDAELGFRNHWYPVEASRNIADNSHKAIKLLGASGSIINISSILSTDPYLASSVYSATKGAVDTLTFALARELGPRGIRVNSILPGHTNTPATDGNFAGEFGEQLIAGTPLRRFGEPEDIAPLAVFLASEDAHWVTGESIRASGGVRGVGY